MVVLQAEEDIELTPEQQRQLAMIDSMPLTIEKEITQEEWDLKTPEEKERIIGMFVSRGLRGPSSEFLMLTARS